MESGSDKGISVFFPAYNDGGTIASMVLSAILVLQSLTDDYEVIVVNDGSSDYTKDILDELERRYGTVRTATGFPDPEDTQPCIVFRPRRRDGQAC